MILFCDSSALLKLYVHEAESPAMAQQAAASETLATSRIAYAECMAALARRVREQPASEREVDRLRRQFSDDWLNHLQVEVTQVLVELAGEFADTFALRGYDSVQLASVQFLHRELPGRVRFACFDNRLNRAARTLGIAVE